MANQVTPVKTRTENYVDETIISTPFPEATSTVDNKLSPCRVVPKPVQSSGTSSRLTNTIKELESFSKALSNVGKMPFVKNASVLVDNETDRTFDSKASLGLLDIDKLLENEIMDDSQDIMKTLYQIRDRGLSMSSKELGKTEAISEKNLFQPSDQDNLPSKANPNQEQSSEKNEMGSPENSVQGVPSCFLASDSYVSEGPSIDSQSFSAHNDSSLREADAEVAAILQKDYSFGAGRLTFEPSELSARSTSIGGSSGNSTRDSGFGLPSMSKNNVEMGFEDEQFLRGEDLIEKLENDEQSLTSKQLPPIVPGCVPNPQKLDISTFSGVVGEGQIVVRPSWIGLEGYGDEPINMSVSEYFRLKSDVLSDTIDVKNCGGERPNFGMDIKSPVKKGRRVPLVSDSFDASFYPPEKTTGSRLNETQVLSTPSTFQNTSIANASVSTDENGSYISRAPSAVATPSLTCINNILSEIDVNDSPDTMARKFLEYTTTSKENKTFFNKNITGQSPSSDRASVKSQMSSRSKRNLNGNQTGKNHDKAVYSKSDSSDADIKKSEKYGITDLIKKLNSVEIESKGNISSIKKMKSLVQNLKQNAPGPLDCSALYESLSNEKYFEDDDDSIISTDNTQAETRFASPKLDCDKDRAWVEIPEEILLPVDEGEISKKLHCIGIGSTFHVPITNVTSSWLKYEVTFLKNKSGGNVVVQKLPIPTLISPESCVEFEAIVAPMSTGRHSIILEIKVTNFMAQEKSAQVYNCQLVLEANIPKVMVMNESMKEINAGDAVDFGLLPELCTKNIQLLILNVGKSDIPIRVVIEEMPSLLHPFEITGATRSPSTDSKKSNTGNGSNDGFSLERKDLLACDLLGSGPNSILAVSFAFSSPNIKNIPHTNARGMDSSKIIKLAAKLKIELDVPSNLSSNLTILKEILLCGSVAETNLLIGVAREPVMLCSEEVVLPLGNHDHKIFKKVSEYIPICNSGVVPLQLKNSIHLLEGNELVHEKDAMAVEPSNITIQPGEKFDVKVTYHPNTNKEEQCDRVLILQVNPNGPSHKVHLRGVSLGMQSGHSMARNEHRPKLLAKRGSSQRLGGTDVIQASQTALVWGSVPIGSNGAERSVALKNSSDMVLRLTLTVNGSDDFKFLNHNSDCVGQASFDLLPKKAEKLKFFFRPKSLGPISGKLSISICDMKYPDRSMPNKMLILLGYGGHSEIEAVSLPKDLAGRLWLNLGLISSFSAHTSGVRSSRPSTPSSSSVKNRIQILNSGTLPSLVKITPLKLGIDTKLLANLEEGREHHVTIKPDEFELAPSSCMTVWITYVHGNFPSDFNTSRNQDNRSKSFGIGSKRVQEEVAKLIVVSGDVPTSSRLHRICKIADVTSNVKSSHLCRDMNAIKLNFIEAATSHDEFQSDGQEEYNKEYNVLCDPVSKEALNSLVQNVSSFEVMLAIEKMESSDEDPRHSVGDLTLALESSSVEYHPLMDDGDTNLFQIPSRQDDTPLSARSNEGEFLIKRHGDEKGNKDIICPQNLTSVRTHGYRENVFADTSAIIFPSTKVGEISSGKLTLKNISPELYEVVFQLPASPFIPPKKQILISGQKHVSFKVKFAPLNPGFYETTMIMKAKSTSSASQNVIIVALKGRAI